jgi:succinate dehydrogenase / fumarate reductase cytochrome b subunit
MTSDERHFLLRRMHSLSGVVPVGLFLLQHIYHNAYAIQGREAFGKITAELQGLPVATVLEVGLIWIPILFHALYGFYVMFTGKNNTRNYGYMKNWMYYLQRITGAFLFFYIIFHVTTTWGTRAHGAEMYDVMVYQLSKPWIFIFYIVGLAAAIFHFSNGLWTFGITWGMTVGAKSQRISGFSCLALGLVLYFVGCWSLLSFKGGV